MARDLPTRESVRFKVRGVGWKGTSKGKKRKRAQVRDLAITFQGRKVFAQDQDEEEDEAEHNGKQEERQVAVDDASGRRAAEEGGAESKRLEELGCELAESGKLTEALAKWQEASRLTPKRAVLFDLRAQVLLDQGNTWPALTSATKAVELDPSWADAHVTLGHAQLNFGEPEMALQSAERALELDPDNKQAKYDQGVARGILESRKREGRAFVTIDSLTRWKMVEREETDFH
jgi:tetratricopeptide (TPR) repeat protein